MQRTSIMLKIVLIGWNVLLGAAQTDITFADQVGNTKKRKISDVVCAEKRFNLKLKAASFQLQNLPYDMHKCIFDLLSSNIQKGSLRDKSRATYRSALSSWCNLCLVSRIFRKHAYHWAERHFGITEYDYRIFKQIQTVCDIRAQVVNEARKNGEISKFGNIPISVRPYALQDQTKRGLLLKTESPKVEWHGRVIECVPTTTLCTPWGALDLLRSMRSDINGIETILAERLKALCAQKNLEVATHYEANERLIRTTAATAIVWNILSAKYTANQ